MDRLNHSQYIFTSYWRAKKKQWPIDKKCFFNFWNYIMFFVCRSNMQAVLNLKCLFCNNTHKHVPTHPFPHTPMKCCMCVLLETESWIESNLRESARLTNSQRYCKDFEHPWAAHLCQKVWAEPCRGSVVRSSCRTRTWWPEEHMTHLAWEHLSVSQWGARNYWCCRHWDGTTN